MSNRNENEKKLKEIYNRLDHKSKILYVAYRNGRLDLDKLNDDMKNRILKLEKEEKGNSGFGRLIKKSKSKKIENINIALNNIDDVFSKEDTVDENDDENDLSEKMIVNFNVFKGI